MFTSYSIIGYVPDVLTAPQGLHKNRKLHINSAANDWSTFRASIHTAYRDRKIKENPNGFLERIETIPTDKEHLSQDELIRLASTPCSALALKRAFLLSWLTALRKSDIKKLTWPILFHQSTHISLPFSMPYKNLLKKPCYFCTFYLLPTHAL